MSSLEKFRKRYKGECKRVGNPSVPDLKDALRSAKIVIPEGANKEQLCRLAGMRHPNHGKPVSKRARAVRSKFIDSHPITYKAKSSHPITCASDMGEKDVSEEEESVSDIELTRDEFLDVSKKTTLSKKRSLFDLIAPDLENTAGQWKLHDLQQKYENTCKPNGGPSRAELISALQYAKIDHDPSASREELCKLAEMRFPKGEDLIEYEKDLAQKAYKKKEKEIESEFEKKKKALDLQMLQQLAKIESKKDKVIEQEKIKIQQRERMLKNKKSQLDEILLAAKKGIAKVDEELGEMPEDDSSSPLGQAGSSPYHFASFIEQALNKKNE